MENLNIFLVCIGLSVVLSLVLLLIFVYRRCCRHHKGPRGRVSVISPERDSFLPSTGRPITIRPAAGRSSAQQNESRMLMTPIRQLSPNAGTVVVTFNSGDIITGEGDEGIPLKELKDLLDHPPKYEDLFPSEFSRHEPKLG